MKMIWKVLGGIGLAVLLVGAYAGYRIALGKLTAVGVQKRDDDYATMERFARQVKEFDRSRLGRQDQLTYDILLDQYETALSFKPFDWLSSEGLYPIAPMWGAQVQLPTFRETQHEVKNAKTARNYVKRLEATGGKLDALTAEMLRQAKAGVVLPISLLEKSESGIKDTVLSSPQDSPLVTTFVERLKGAKGLDAAERSELARQDKVGQLKILELRERAKTALGPKFDLKDFHAVVLENGGIPLTLLDKLVDEWIAKTKG